MNMWEILQKYSSQKSGQLRDPKLSCLTNLLSAFGGGKRRLKIFFGKFLQITMAVFTGKFNRNKRWKRLVESEGSEKN